MKVTEKTEELFRRIEEITKASFFGVETPNRLALKWAFENGDVFIYSRDTDFPAVHGYAIVAQDGGHPFLWSLAIDPEWQGRGEGTFLMREVLQHYFWKHAERMDLTVNANNPAQKFYFDHGFRVIRLLPKYYGEIAGLRMRRKI